MKKIGYIRVSKQEQRPDRQIIGLEDLCDEVHIEKLSAVSRNRPVFEDIIRRLEPGDTLVVWDLDRAFRSVIDALNHCELLRERGIEFKIVNLQIDTETPAGMLVYTLMSALAEFERSNLVKRTREGLAAARHRGVRLGRPPKLTPRQIERARRELRRPHVTIGSLAEEFGVAPWTLSRALKREKEGRRQWESSDKPKWT